MSNLELKQQILEKIQEFDTIIIHRHIRPDGDCMGSTLGLRDLLRHSFPNKKVYSSGKHDSPYLKFLGDEDEISDEVYKDALVIVVDTATSDRIYDERYKLGKFLIKIDHHIAVENYGHLNYVREDLPATCAIIGDFYETFKTELVLTKVGAHALYVGLTTDTGRFKYRGVNGDVMRIAGTLLDFDLDLERIYASLYLKDSKTFILQGYVYENFKQTPNGVSYIYFSRKTQKKYGVTPEDAAALVNSLDSIKGNMIWIAFVEQADKSIRVRMRSRFVRVVEVASLYRGGGHANAAGATVYNKKEMQDLLLLADKALKEFKAENQDLN